MAFKTIKQFVNESSSSTIDTWIAEYNAWNKQGGENSGYSEPTATSVKEFFENNHEDALNDDNIAALLAGLQKAMSFTNESSGDILKRFPGGTVGAHYIYYKDSKPGLKDVKSTIEYVEDSLSFWQKQIKEPSEHDADIQSYKAKVDILIDELQDLKSMQARSFKYRF